MQNGKMYNPKNVGVVFVLMGAFLFFVVAGEFAFKALFVFLSLICVDYGFRLMGRPPLFVTIQDWLDKIRR